MASTTISLDLFGEVDIGHFARAMTHLRRLVEALEADIETVAPITWTVDDLGAGSAKTLFRGVSEEMESVDKVARAYLEVGRSLRRSARPAYSLAVTKEASALVRLIGGEVTSIRFGAEDEEPVEITASDIGRPPALTYSYGAIEGRVSTITDRRGLRFQLYDALYDKPVTCYLHEEQEDIMRNVWHRRALVEGRIGRDTETGRPVTITNITDVVVLSDPEPRAYLSARGVLPTERGEGRSEDLIRRTRDAW